MTNALVAADYSRPIRPLFEQPPRIGVIQGIFHRAMNIALDDTVLSVLSDELPSMPNGVRVPSVLIEEILRSLHTGMNVLIGDGELLIPGADLSLSLPTSPPWEPRPAVEERRWCRMTVVQHGHLLARYLADQHQQHGLGSLAGPLLLKQSVPKTPLERLALPQLRLLARASWQLDRAGVEVAANGLAGLGPGLTPAGDDALGGFAAVMALLSPYLSADAVPRKHIAETLMTIARSRTTKLSAVLLAHAACGEVSEQLGQMLLALALPTEQFETVLQAAQRVLAFGATSGSDTLLGVLLGLQTLEGSISDDLADPSQSV
jgi:hypothetical protein